MQEQRRLHRSSRDRMLFGVAGGLGEYFDVDPIIWRLAFVVMTLFGGSGILIYIVLAIIMPQEGKEFERPAEVVRENVAEMGRTAHEATRELGDWVRPSFGEAAEAAKARRRRTAGLVLVLAGVLLLAANLNMFSWLRWDLVWPVLLIALGVAVLIGQRR